MPLYALGSNSSYQLSLRHRNDVSTPSLTTLHLPSGHHPVKIVAGSNHTLLLTNAGTLYATGANKYGQCMRPACPVIPGFMLLEGKWRDCAATWEGSIVVREDGSVLCFGKVRGYKEGNATDIEILHKEVEFDDDGFGSNGEMNVVGGVQYFVVFGKQGIFGYGDARKGQFGTLSQSPPIKIPLENIIQISCGKDFTIFLSNNDTITIYPTNTKYNLHLIPPCRDISSILSSWSTIAILHNSGNITSWGRSDRGQFPPTGLPLISQLAAGSEHFIALSRENKVYTWGWNEHGNCGTQDQKDVTFLNEISFPDGETPIYVAAGCGTSWIWTS
jgi:protein ATS1